MESSTASSATSPPTPAHWVVGVDGSECSRHAARWAVQHAHGRADSVELAIAWAIPAAPALPPVGAMKPYWDVDAFEADARRSVDELTGEFSGRSDLGLTTSVRQGHASSVLLDASREARLLVVGTRGRGGFARLVLGSTSTQCATHSIVPTAVIPRATSTDPAQRIVVAVDGSRNSLDAARWAIEFAMPGCTVDCVLVWDSTPIVAGTDLYVVPDGGDDLRAALDDEVASLITQAGPAADGVTVSHRFLEGRPRQELTRVAEEADLLVMGARGRGALGAALLGSVSTWLLHHVDKPMVVVPRRVSSDASTISTDATGPNM